MLKSDTNKYLTSWFVTAHFFLTTTNIPTNTYLPILYLPAVMVDVTIHYKSVLFFHHYFTLQKFPQIKSR
jgi:hypothetical protein